MEAELILEEKKVLERKLVTLHKQKEKLTGSKNKRDRAKLNKQISQAEKKLKVLERDLQNTSTAQARKEELEKKKAELEKAKKEREKEDNNYLKELEDKHGVKDATTKEIVERIASRKGEKENFHFEEFWNILLREHDEEKNSEDEKQSKWLKAYGLTKADQEETVKKITERKKLEAEEKAKAALEILKEGKAKKEGEPENITEKKEETGDKPASGDVPKAFPGFKSDEAEAGVSEGPEEAITSEKPEEAEEAPAGSEPTADAEEPAVDSETKEPTVDAASETPASEETPKEPKKNYGSAEYWDERYDKYADKSEEWYEGWDTLRSMIEPFLSKNMTVLDFGCGDSFLQDELLKEGYCVFGTDISHVVLQRLSEQPEREMQAADGFALPYRSNSWDVIIDKGTLDAIACDEERDLSPLFNELNRVLRPGGRYLCVTPWHGEKRIPQLSLTDWEISHEVQAMSLKTLTRQRFNQLRNHPKLGKDKKLLHMMSLRQAKNELNKLDMEKAKELPPERSCVIHCYVCQKKT